MAEVKALGRVEYVKVVGTDPGSIERYWVLVGEAGAVHFGLIDWHPLCPIEKRTIDTEFMVKFGHPLYPMPMEVGYHSPAPLNPMQSQIDPWPCDWLPNGQCWGDGTTMLARDVYMRWQGADCDDTVIWAELQSYYANRLLGDGAQDIAHMDLGETLGLLGRILGDDEEEE